MVSHDFGGDINARVAVVELFDRRGQPITNELYVDKRQNVIEMVNEGGLTPQRVRVAKHDARGQGSRAKFVDYSPAVAIEGSGNQPGNLAHVGGAVSMASLSRVSVGHYLPT